MKYVPCKFCGCPTPPATSSIHLVTHICDACRSVVTRLPEFLENEGGWQHVLEQVLTEDLAHAIVDMDDHGFSEGLGPETLKGAAAWEALVVAAELIADRKADATRCAEMQANKKWAAACKEYGVGEADGN